MENYLRMNAENLKVLITMDKNCSQQQHLAKNEFSLIVENSKDNTYKSLLKLMPKVLVLLNHPIETDVVILEL